MDTQVAIGENPYASVPKTRPEQGSNLRESLDTLYRVLSIIRQEAGLAEPKFGLPSPDGLEHTLAYCIDEVQTMGDMARDIHQYMRRIGSMVQGTER